MMDEKELIKEVKNLRKEYFRIYNLLPEECHHMFGYIEDYLNITISDLKDRETEGKE